MVASVWQSEPACSPPLSSLSLSSAPPSISLTLTVPRRKASPHVRVGSVGRQFQIDFPLSLMCHTSNVLLHNSVGVSYQPNAPLVPNQMRVLSSGLGPQATGLLLGGTPYCSLWHRDSSGLCGQHQVSGSAVRGRQQHVHCMCMLCVVARQYPQRYAINLHTTSAILPFPPSSNLSLDPLSSSPSFLLFLPPPVSPSTLPPSLPFLSPVHVPPSSFLSLDRPSLLLSLLSPVHPYPSLSLDSPSFFPSPFSPPLIASKGNISLHVQL